MAQLRDTTIDGNLEVTGVVNLQTNKPIKAINPINGEMTNMLSMSNDGDTLIAYGSFVNAIGKTRLYGNNIQFHVASAGNAYFIPYYKAGDVINFTVRTSGYVTNSGKNVVFTIPITKPVIGAPTATAYSNNGLLLRQGGKYTHGSDGAGNSTVYAKPTAYTVESNYNSGFIVTAYFDVATNAVNNNTIGVYWDGNITLS